MPGLLLLAPTLLCGKTTVACGLAQRLSSQGTAVSLVRLGGDANADSDRALFGLVAPESGARIIISEAPTGEVPEGQDKAIVVADAAAPLAETAEFCKALGPRLAGVILNRTPSRRTGRLRADAEAAGLKLLGLLPEDRLLASPTLGDVAGALGAETLFLDSQAGRPLERTLIASISADPGQGYFARTGANTVIVRSDKPDLQLAALNAGAWAMIITGDLPLLGYVLDRVEEDSVPLLRTRLGTVETVKAIEELYAAKPFAGGVEKLRRAAELVGEIDLAPLLS